MPANENQANGQPTETSPLISRNDIQAAKADTGLAPEGPHGITSDDEADAADGDTLERQISAHGTQKQYEGLPEVKKNLKYIVPAVAIGIFLGAADQTIVVSSYGKIGSDLGALNLTSWIATAYFLTLTAFQPLYGKLSDIFGRKSCLLTAYTIFGTGCVFCGLARDMQQLILARAYAGIGGGGMNVVVSVLLSDIVPLRERGKWQGYINIVFAAGASSGAPLGGLLADSIGWRWSFIGQGPICLIAFIAVSFALHMPKKDDSHWKEKFRRIDFLGAAILLAAVSTLLLALDRGSNVSWKAVITLVNLGVSIPLFVAFILVEMKVAKEPFAPGRIIFNPTMIACFLCNFFSMAGYLAALFYVPLYFQAVDGLSSAGAGVRLIPAIVGSVIGSLFGGFYMQKTGKFYWLTIGCYIQLTIGLIIVTLASGVLTQSTPLIIVGMAIAALGNGVGVTTTLIGLIANASHDDQAIATACSYLFRSLGSVFGISMSATVANQALRTNLANELPKLGLPEKKAAAIADRVRVSLEYLKHLEPDVRALVIDCYAKSATAAFLLQVVLLAGAAISAWWIKEKALSR